MISTLFWKADGIFKHSRLSARRWRACQGLAVLAIEDLSRHTSTGFRPCLKAYSTFPLVLE
jgi:hypothetical protein